LTSVGTATIWSRGDQRGLLAHVDDLQVDVAAEFFPSQTRRTVLDGVDGTRGRAV